MSGEVIGLPKFQLIREFFDGLVGPFEHLKVDVGRQRELVELLRKIEETVDSGWFRKEVGEIVRRAHVEEVRRCKDGSLVAHYSYGEDGETLLVRYSPLRQLIAYTFVADEPQPFEISAALCGDSPDAVDTTRWEDVVALSVRHSVPKQPTQSGRQFLHDTAIDIPALSCIAVFARF